MLSKGESKSLEDNTNTNSILQIKNLSKIYYRNPGKSSSIAEDEYKVLSNINLDIKNGEFVTIIGPSGCGKSTLLNIIAGIDKEYGIGGEILFNDGQSDHVGNNSSANSTGFIQDKILIFQEAALFPWLTVIENVEFGLKVAKIPKEKRKNIAMAPYRNGSIIKFCKLLCSSIIRWNETTRCYCSSFSTKSKDFVDGRTICCT